MMKRVDDMRLRLAEQAGEGEELARLEPLPLDGEHLPLPERLLNLAECRAGKRFR